MKNKFFPDEEITEAGLFLTSLFRFVGLNTTVKIKNEYLRIFVYNNR